MLDSHELLTPHCGHSCSLHFPSLVNTDYENDPRRDQTAVRMNSTLPGLKNNRIERLRFISSATLFQTESIKSDLECFFFMFSNMNTIKGEREDAHSSQKLVFLSCLSFLSWLDLLCPSTCPQFHIQCYIIKSNQTMKVSSLCLVT